jgi:trimeric autotransporter adhesin
MQGSTRYLAVLAAGIFAGSAIGCGGGGSGTTTTTTQTQTPATPAIASLSPASVIVGSPDTTLTVSGSGFVPGTEITWQGGQVPTLYLSSTSLQTDLPASDLTTAGTYQVAVEDPADIGGATSSSVPFTISNQTSSGGLTFVNTAANDLAWDPVNQVIYLSLPSAAGANGNAVQVLNPATGILGTNVFAGSEPDLLAVSGSSQYLYVALDGSSSLQRFNLPALTTDINISFGPASFYGPYLAMDVEASPAADSTVAFVHPAAQSGVPG